MAAGSAAKAAGKPKGKSDRTFEGPKSGDAVRYSYGERSSMVMEFSKALTPLQVLLITNTGNFPQTNDFHAQYKSIRNNLYRMRSIAEELREESERAQHMRTDESDNSEASGGEGSEGSDDDGRSGGYSGSDSGVDSDDEDGTADAETQARYLATLQAAEDTEAPDAPAEWKPSHSSVKEATKRFVKRFLQHGHVHDIAPHEQGYKVRRNAPELLKIYNMLKAGWFDMEGRQHVYAGIDDLERRNRRDHDQDRRKPLARQKLNGVESFAALREKMGLSDNQQVAAQLKLAHPDLRRVKLSCRRPRKDQAKVVVCIQSSCTRACACPAVSCGSCDQRCWSLSLVTLEHISVVLRGTWQQIAWRLARWDLACVHPADLGRLDLQRGAKMALGELPMKFEPSIHKDLRYGRRACWKAGVESGKDFFWKHENAYRQWHIDALSIDWSRMLGRQTGLFPRGSDTQQPVCESSVHNASPGSVPVVQVFIAAHVEHGVLAFYPMLSSKGGPKGAFEGFSWWCSNLDEASERLLRDMGHYNQPEVVADLPEAVLKAMKTMGAPINRTHFKVCPCAALQYMPLCCLTVHCASVHALWLQRAPLLVLQGAALQTRCPYGQHLSNWLRPLTVGFARLHQGLPLSCLPPIPSLSSSAFGMLTTAVHLDSDQSASDHHAHVYAQRHARAISAVLVPRAERVLLEAPRQLACLSRLVHHDRCYCSVIELSAVIVPFARRVASRRTVLSPPLCHELHRCAYVAALCGHALVTLRE